MLHPPTRTETPTRGSLLPVASDTRLRLSGHGNHTCCHIYKHPGGQIILCSRVQNYWLSRDTQKHCPKAVFLTRISDRKPVKIKDLLSECFRTDWKTCGKPIFRGGFTKGNPVIFLNFTPCYRSAYWKVATNDHNFTQVPLRCWALMILRGGLRNNKLNFTISPHE